MTKTVAAVGIAVILAAAAGPAFARKPHHRHAHPAPAPYSKINSGWGPPSNWDEIEISTPSGGP
jgi:hypothetical protein